MNYASYMMFQKEVAAMSARLFPLDKKRLQNEHRHKFVRCHCYGNYALYMYSYNVRSALAVAAVPSKELHKSLINDHRLVCTDMLNGLGS